MLHQVDETTQNRFGNMYLNGAVVAVGERKRLLNSADAENELEVDDVFATKTDELRLGPGDIHQPRLNVTQSVGNHEVGGTGIEDMGVVVVGLHVDDFLQVDDVKLVVSTET